MIANTHIVVSMLFQNNWGNSGDGLLEEVHTLKNTFSSDLQMLILDNSDTSAAGFAFDFSNGSNELSQYSVVRLLAAGLNFYTTSHEVGE